MKTAECHYYKIYFYIYFCIFYNREWPLRLTFSYFHQLNVWFLCCEVKGKWEHWPTKHHYWLIDWMVFYAAFNSISVISWRQLTLFMLSWVSPVLTPLLAILLLPYDISKQKSIPTLPHPGGSVVSTLDSWPGSCELDPRLRRSFFLAYFRLSPLQKHVRKVVGGFRKKSWVSTGVRKPGNSCASPTPMIWLQLLKWR